jgi:hypothetical protein
LQAIDSSRPATSSILPLPIPGRLRWPVAVALVVIGWAYAFWLLRVAVRPWNDFAFVCAAGRTWLKGGSPYDFATWNAEWTSIRPSGTLVSQPMPFVYPPHWAPIAVLAAAVPWPVASRAWDVVSVLSFAATAWCSLRLLGSAAPGAIRMPRTWASLGFAALNPAVRYSAWQSQMALFATVGIVGAFWAWHERRIVWLAVFTFLASLKPQLALPALVYLFFSGGHLGVLLGAVAATTVGLFAMIPSGLAALPAQMRHDYALHVAVDFNGPAQFSNLLAFFPWPGGSRPFLSTSMAVGVAASLGLVLATRQARRWNADLTLDPLWQLGIVVALTGALMPLHGYDLVIYTPLIVLAGELRWRWISSIIVFLTLFAAREKFLTTLVPITPIGACLTTAILLTMIAALALHWRRQPSLVPVM